MRPKGADGMANSVDFDQTTQGLIWFYKQMANIVDPHQMSSLIYLHGLPKIHPSENLGTLRTVSPSTV